MAQGSQEADNTHSVVSKAITQNQYVTPNPSL